MAKVAVVIGEQTPDKVEIVQIADRLGIHPDCALGLCIRFWRWCKDQAVDGTIPLTASGLDAYFSRQGFTDALLAVGWLQDRNGRLVVPNCDRYISQSAVDRVDAAIRQRRRRSRDVCHEDVTEKRDKPVTDVTGGDYRGGSSSGKSSSKDEYQKDFEDWWKVYPRKASKPTAAKAFKKALRAISTEYGDDAKAWLLGVTSEFAASPKGQGEFCPYPASWLNQRRYEDDRSEWQRAGGASDVRGAGGANSAARLRTGRVVKQLRDERQRTLEAGDEGRSSGQ